MIQQKIKDLTKKGEGISIEFKECKTELTKDVYPTICAFLNRNGGELLLGVNDSRVVVGIDKDKIEQIKKDFITAINNPEKISPSVYLSIEEVEIKGKKILYIYVPRSSQVHKCNNKIYDRNEDGALDINQNSNHPWKKLTNIELLKSAKLYTKDYQTNEEGITLAGILLFGKDETILSVLPHYKTDLILRRVNLKRNSFKHSYS